VRCKDGKEFGPKVVYREKDGKIKGKNDKPARKMQGKIGSKTLVAASLLE